MPEASILAVNSGSSSLKFALFDGDGEKARLRGSIGGIGAQTRIHLKDGDGHDLQTPQAELPDAQSALDWMLDCLEQRGEKATLNAVGHRLVHGGPRQFDPLPLDQAALDQLRQVVPFAPLHLPAELAAIETIGWGLHGKPQFAVFDTQFHRDMPAPARHYPLPQNFADSGVVRYGFHGLSYQSCLRWLRRQYGEAAAQGRLLVLHLGSGCSLAAIRDGRSLDCTMGFSPTGGVTMGTRSGDLDPGLLLYLLEREGMAPRPLGELLQRRSGLLGLSGGRSADPGELLRHEEEDPAAHLALEVFCHSVRKALGALAAVLGGLDRVVFTGGVGEHLPQIRARVCRDFEYLGLRLDEAANRANAARISPDGALPVHVAPADEEGVIATAVAACLNHP